MDLDRVACGGGAGRGGGRLGDAGRRPARGAAGRRAGGAAGHPRRGGRLGARHAAGRTACGAAHRRLPGAGRGADAPGIRRRPLDGGRLRPPPRVAGGRTRRRGARGCDLEHGGGAARRREGSRHLPPRAAGGAHPCGPRGPRRHRGGRRGRTRARDGVGAADARPGRRAVAATGDAGGRGFFQRRDGGAAGQRRGGIGAGDRGGGRAARGGRAPHPRLGSLADGADGHPGGHRRGEPAVWPHAQGGGRGPGRGGPRR